MKDQSIKTPNPQKKITHRPVVKASLGIIFGAIIGLIIGNALGSPALGLIFGAGIGLLFGAMLDRQRK